MTIARKVKGFILSGPLSEVNVQKAYTDDWDRVTDIETLTKVCKMAHVAGGDAFADYSEYYGVIYGGEMTFSMKDSVPYINVQYSFDVDVEIIEEDDIIIIDDANKSLEDFIDDIASETAGQCSDGIGEGFEQNPCYDEGEMLYFISPGYPTFTHTFTYD